MNELFASDRLPREWKKTPDSSAAHFFLSLRTQCLFCPASRGHAPSLLSFIALLYIMASTMFWWCRLLCYYLPWSQFQARYKETIKTWNLILPFHPYWRKRSVAFAFVVYVLAIVLFIDLCLLKCAFIHNKKGIFSSFPFFFTQALRNPDLLLSLSLFVSRSL